MQQPSSARGPLVWRDMDQKTLDDAYNQAAYAPNMDLILGRIAAASEATRETRCPTASPMGQARMKGSTVLALAPLPTLARQRGRKEQGAPVNVFVHGGA